MKYDNVYLKPTQTFHSHLVLNCFQILYIKYYPHPVYLILPFKTLLDLCPISLHITLTSLKISTGHLARELISDHLHVRSLSGLS